MKILAGLRIPINLGYCTYDLKDNSAVDDILYLLQVCDPNWGGEGYIDVQSGIKSDYVGGSTSDHVLFFKSNNCYLDFKRVLKLNGLSNAIKLGKFSYTPQYSNPVYLNFSGHV